MPSGTSITRTSGSGNPEPIRARAPLQRRRRRAPTLAALASCIACVASTARPARAAEAPDDRDKALPCRPTIACTADLVPPGTLDVETGALFRRFGSGSTVGASPTRQWSFPFLAKLTLAPWVQVQLGSNGYTAERGARAGSAASFFDDAEVVAKFHLHDQTAMTPSISLSAGASIPTAAGQLGYLRTYDASFIAYVTKDLGPVHVDFNAVVNVWRIDASPLTQELVALALTANTPPPFGVMGEAYAQTDASPVSSRDGGFLFAFSHSPRPWLVFDIGGDVGWFPSERNYSVFIGMSFIPVVFWRPTEAGASGASDTHTDREEHARVGDPARD
jgi:hypothetical protein